QAQSIREGTGINNCPETTMQTEVVICAFTVQGVSAMDHLAFNRLGLVRRVDFDMHLLQISEIVEWNYNRLMAGVIPLEPISTITINQTNIQTLNSACMLQQVNVISNLPPDR